MKEERRKTLADALSRSMQRVADLITGNGLMQSENTRHSEGTVTEEISALARQCAAEGAVLLKNDGTLPLNRGKKIAVFGRCQLDWFYVGYGSGGDVQPPYRVNLMDGLKNAGVACDMAVAGTYRTWCESSEHKADHGWWGHWPMSHPEMPLQPSLVTNAAKRCDTALVVIGRAAGEDRENTLTPGSYYLTAGEKAMLDAVTSAFGHTVVLLNAGGIFDLSWTETYADKISALLLVWQGGMESGNAAADVLTGKMNPCGKLSDTIARHYMDYPGSNDFGGAEYNFYTEDIFVGYRYFETFAKEKVLYPFGHGLSYTAFQTEAAGFTENNGQYTVTAQVTNTGTFPGKEVAMLWCEAPQGRLGKPRRVLTAYAKTKLLAPGEVQSVMLSFDNRAIASFDDTGVTGHLNAFVLEDGIYRFFLGDTEAASITIGETIVLQQCEAACCVKIPFTRLKAVQSNGDLLPGRETVPAGTVDLRQRILDNLPAQIPCAKDSGYTLSDVAGGRISLDAFIAQLSDKELEALTRGEGNMQSALGPAGNAGAFGGILPSLRRKGIPPIITADGPSGIRLKRRCSLLPCGTAIACTWNDSLIEELFSHVGMEVAGNGLDILLSPGMNIHRNVLCGRNFEYFSEDPLLTGKIAAAVVRGIQSQGVSCCPKHFACNNQETKRNTNDSRVSSRALREIYLRGFEICVKESKPHSLMTSYNKINGTWSHYNYDLVTTILRKEWGFDGLVLTDWWMRRSASPEFPKLRDNAYRVRAQVDVLMPGNMVPIGNGYRSDGTLLRTLEKKDGICRAELQRTAKNVLTYILRNKKM